MLTPRYFLALAFLSCGDERPCKLPLNEACYPCSTFEEAIDAFVRPDSGHTDVVASTCAEGGSKIEYSAGLWFWSDYFDASGDQVARTTTTDNPISCGLRESYLADYGDVPTCTSECYVDVLCGAVHGDASCTDLPPCEPAAAP